MTIGVCHPLSSLSYWEESCLKHLNTKRVQLGDYQSATCNWQDMCKSSRTWCNALTNCLQGLGWMSVLRRPSSWQTKIGNSNQFNSLGSKLLIYCTILSKDKNIKIGSKLKLMWSLIISMCPWGMDLNYKTGEKNTRLKDNMLP